MGNLIPRKKIFPVQARRVEPPPQMIQIPGADPIPVPPAQPGVTQNIIYVNVPAGQAPPPAAPPPQVPAQAPQPQEVHFHTTNVYNLPKRRRATPGTSFFGSLGLVIGGLAIGAAYVPPIQDYAKPIAEAGAACAALGFVVSMLFRRSGVGVPVLGLIICGVGYGLWLKNNGQLPKIDVPTVNTPATPAQTKSPEAPPAVSSPAPAAPVPSTPAQPRRLGGIEGMFQNTPATPAATPPAAAPSVAAPPVIRLSSSVDLTTAKSNLENARVAAAAKMGVDYTAAKAAMTEATSEYETARITDTAGSPELLAASQKHLLAESQWNGLLAKLHADPAVAAAEAALKGGKSEIVGAAGATYIDAAEAARKAGPTQEKYEKIKNGMTRADVEQIMGYPGTTESQTQLDGVDFVRMTWSAELGGRSLTVTFQGGRLTAKNLWNH